MSLLTKVIPQGLNYSDIKPESIDTEIKLVKYTPTSTINDVRRGEVIKFMLSGLGFLDPYSTFLKFKVHTPNLSNVFLGEYRTLDRSAHSFISQIIIKSQGTELERITDYDMMAAMVNDMIYSSEQNQIHSWEGFPTQQMQLPDPLFNYGSQEIRVSGVGLPHDVGAATRSINTARRHAFQMHHMGAAPFIKRFIGEQTFYDQKEYQRVEAAGQAGDSIQSELPVGANFFYGEALYNQGARAPHANADDFMYVRNIQQRVDKGELAFDEYQLPSLDPRLDNITSLTPVDFCYHQRGYRQTSTLIPGGIQPDFPANTAVPQGNRRIRYLGNDTMEFIIPLYSGIIGVMMPDKKLLPLGLMPLEIEIHLNNEALYTSIPDGSRDYIVKDFNLYSHVIFFESDIHKQLEAQCAQHGIFLYCNSFVQAARHQIPTASVPSTLAIQTNLKSMNSIHLLFTYNAYHTIPTARKLHFVSHNIDKLQIKNGTNVIPTYPIEGRAGESKQGQHIPFLVELMKAYNKLHDPKTDGAIHPFNFCGDEYGGQFEPLRMDYRTTISSYQSLLELINKQANVGRCQYALTFEGEELGADKLMVTGRKVEYPFYVELYSEGKVTPRPSYMTTFIRCDFIVYIRPDLQIVVLGK